MPERGWRRAFEERIKVDGRKLVKLLDAGEFLALAFLRKNKMRALVQGRKIFLARDRVRLAVPNRCHAISA